MIFRTKPVFVRLGWKSLPETHSSLLLKFVNYGQKKFYNIGPWGKYHKIY